MEGGTPSHPAFAPDGSGFHPLSGPSLKKLPAGAVSPVAEQGEATIGTMPAANTPTSVTADGRSSLTSTTSGSVGDTKEGRTRTGEFSPMSNHLASLNLQGSHATRR